MWSRGVGIGPGSVGRGTWSSGIESAGPHWRKLPTDTPVVTNALRLSGFLQVGTVDVGPRDASPGIDLEFGDSRRRSSRRGGGPVRRQEVAQQASQAKSDPPTRLSALARI
jgi:hypothetical protein